MWIIKKTKNFIDNITKDYVGVKIKAMTLVGTSILKGNASNVDMGQNYLIKYRIDKLASIYKKKWQS